MDTAEVVTRFKAERQALAMDPRRSRGCSRRRDTGRRVAQIMEHQGRTVGLLHATGGPLPNGSLFLQVDGVRAHQKGVIHRDLKPSNVLVPQDDRRF